MHKELNPDIFGERSPGSSSREQVYDIRLSPTDPLFLQLSKQVNDLKLQQQSLFEQFQRWMQSTQEHLKVSQQKFERMQQNLARLEQGHNGFVQEVQNKVGQLSQRFQERKNFEMKVQEMVDRHNNVLKSFEVRMNHMQKLMAEKEAQVQAAQMALNDTKMEIARLKRL